MNVQPMLSPDCHLLELEPDSYCFQWPNVDFESSVVYMGRISAQGSQRHEQYYKFEVRLANIVNHRPARSTNPLRINEFLAWESDNVASKCIYIKSDVFSVLREQPRESLWFFSFSLAFSVLPFETLSPLCNLHSS